MTYKLALIILLLLLCPLAQADGMKIIWDKDMWFLGEETLQLAAIHYENDRQNMLLSIGVGTSEPGEEAVWLFHIPSTPDTVTIDIIDGFPNYYGISIEEQYERAVRTAVDVM